MSVEPLHLADAALVPHTNQRSRRALADFAAKAFLVRYRIKTTRDGYQLALRQQSGRPSSLFLGPLAKGAPTPPTLQLDVVRVPSRAVSLSSVGAGEADATKHVGAVVNYLQMVRSDAQRHPAQMVHVEALCKVGRLDHPSEHKRQTVCCPALALPVEPAVAAVGGVAGPQPAVARLVDVRPEASRSLEHGPCRRSSGAPPELVVGVAHVACGRRALAAGDRARWLGHPSILHRGCDSRGRDKIERNVTHGLAAYVERAT